jgi:hypothetical protein
VQLGQVRVKELLECTSAEILIHYLLKEVELLWRMKFAECQQLAYKAGVDQFILILDLKGAKLKDLSNKQVSHFLL